MFRMCNMQYFSSNICNTVVALYLGSDFVHLEVLHVSHAVDHILRLLAERIERALLL